MDFSGAGSTAGIRSVAVANGDFLRVLPLEDQLQDVVLLSGRVERPGGYQYRHGMRITDLVPGAEALLPGADIDFVLVKREHPETLRTAVHYSRLLDAIEQPGGAADLPLQPRDQVIVFDLKQPRAQALEEIVSELQLQATERRPAQVVDTRGAVRFPGRLPLQSGARLLDVLALSGGLLTGADLHYGVIARTLYPSRDIEVSSFSVAAAQSAPGGEGNPVIAPGDRLYFFDEDAGRSELMAEEIDRLRRQASFGAEEQLVTVLGEVQHAGTFPLENGMRASDLLCAAGGLSRKAYGVTAELSTITYDMSGDNNTEHRLLDTLALLDICEFKRRVARGTATAAEYRALSLPPSLLFSSSSLT